MHGMDIKLCCSFPHRAFLKSSQSDTAQHNTIKEQHNKRNGVLPRTLQHYGPKHSWIQWTHILPTYII